MKKLVIWQAVVVVVAIAIHFLLPLFGLSEGGTRMVITYGSLIVAALTPVEFSAILIVPFVVMNMPFFSKTDNPSMTNVGEGCVLLLALCLLSAAFTIRSFGKKGIGLEFEKVAMSFITMAAMLGAIVFLGSGHFGLD